MVLFLLSPQRGMIIENGFAKPIDSIAIGKRLQDLETIFHDAGQFYWINTIEFLNNPDILMNHTSIFHVPETEVQDIDNEDDWMIVEIKYKLLMKEKE